MQSDPKTGKLNYKRPVTTDDVIHFLQVKTDYDDDRINKAIKEVLGQGPNGEEGAENDQDTNLPAVRTPSGAVDVNTRGMSPGQQQPKIPGQPGPAAPTQPPAKKYDTSGATDVEPRYGARKALSAPASDNQPSAAPPANTPGGQPPALRNKKGRTNRKGNLREDFKDVPGAKLSEKQVENIFKILAKPVPAAEPDKKSIDPQQVRIDEVNKLKRFIRDKLSDQQRMSLWRALQDA